MNLIVGATGQVGGAIVRLLRQRNEPVRALVRLSSDPAKVKALSDLGAQIVIGDLSSVASLRSACTGVTTVVSTASMIGSQQTADTFSGVDDEGQRGLIDAAAAAGVNHLVFVSVTGNITVPCPLIDAKRSVEQHLQKSALAYTILRPSAFMEFWLTAIAGFDHSQRQARVLGDGTQEISYIAAGDVARFAAACVGNRAARGRVIELGGPEPLSPLRIIQVFERLAGGAYTVQHVPREALEAQYAAADHPTQKSFAALLLALSSNDRIPMTATAREFGLELTSVQDFAAKSLSIGVTA